MNRVEIAGDGIEILWLGSELEFSGAAEITVYSFLRNDRLDGVDGSVKRLVE